MVNNYCLSGVCYYLVVNNDANKKYIFKQLILYILLGLNLNYM